MATGQYTSARAYKQQKFTGEVLNNKQKPHYPLVIKTSENKDGSENHIWLINKSIIYIHKAAFCLCAVKYFAGCDWSIGKDLARFLAKG